MKMANPDPLTRPATAGGSAVSGHPLPQGGEGIFVTRGEPKDYGIFARNDRVVSCRPNTDNHSSSGTSSAMPSPSAALLFFASSSEIGGKPACLRDEFKGRNGTRSVILPFSGP